MIVDEANRLRDAGLEVIRDLANRGEFGLVLLGMTGLEKRLMRAPQLYSRVGFAHEMEPLSEEETHDFLGKRWSHRVKPHSDDFTDKEAVAMIVRIARGNLCLIDRLMLQVEHVLMANKLQVVTKEVSRLIRNRSPLAAEYSHLPFVTTFFEPLEMFLQTSQAAHLVSWSVQFVLILINSILHHFLGC